MPALEVLDVVGVRSARGVGRPPSARRAGAPPAPASAPPRKPVQAAVRAVRPRSGVRRSQDVRAACGAPAAADGAASGPTHVSNASAVPAGDMQVGSAKSSDVTVRQVVAAATNEFQEKTITHEIPGVSDPLRQQRDRYASGVGSLLDFADELTCIAESLPLVRPPRLLHGIAAGRRAKLEEAVRRRVRSLRFLAEQQARLGDDFKLRQADLLAQKEEAAQLLEEHSPSIAPEGTQAMCLAEAQALLADVEQRCVEEARVHQSELDARQMEVDECTLSANQVEALIWEQERSLTEAQDAMIEFEREADQLCQEAAMLQERRAETWAREVALRTMEVSWETVMARHRRDGGVGLGVDRSSALDALCAEAAERIATDLINSEPYMRQLKELLHAVTQPGGSAQDLRAVAKCAAVADQWSPSRVISSEGAHGRPVDHGFSQEPRRNHVIVNGAPNSDWDRVSAGSIADLETVDPGDDHPVEELPDNTETRPTTDCVVPVQSRVQTFPWTPPVWRQGLPPQHHSGPLLSSSVARDASVARASSSTWTSTPNLPSARPARERVPSATRASAPLLPSATTSKDSPAVTTLSTPTVSPRRIRLMYSPARRSPMSATAGTPEGVDSRQLRGNDGSVRSHAVEDSSARGVSVTVAIRNGSGNSPPWSKSVGPRVDGTPTPGNVARLRSGYVSSMSCPAGPPPSSSRVPPPPNSLNSQSPPLLQRASVGSPKAATPQPASSVPAPSPPQQLFHAPPPYKSPAHMDLPVVSSTPGDVIRRAILATPATSSAATASSSLMGPTSAQPPWPRAVVLPTPSPRVAASPASSGNASTSSLQALVIPAAIHGCGRGTPVLPFRPWPA